MKNPIRHLILLLVCCTLVACASRLRPSDIVNQQFLTDIKPNNSKLFVYIASFRTAKLDKSEDVVNHPNNQNAAKQLIKRKRQEANSRSLETKLIDALESKLASTGYCRDGYYILSQYIEFGSGEVRGECRESATEADRAIFGS